VRCALIVVALATLLPAGVPVTAASAPAYFTRAGAATIPAGDTVLIAPLSDGAGLRVLIWQVEAGLRWRMVDGNAYGADHTLYFPATTLTDTLAAMESGVPTDTGARTLATMRDDLRHLGVGTVIVAASGHQTQELQLMRDVLGPETSADGWVHVWHNVGDLIARAPPTAG
jgi:hypothetical protein